METTGRWQLTLGELRVALRAADPAAVLCPPRILRRVIKQHRRISGPGLHVPHHECYVISRRELLEIAEPAEMGLADASQLAELVVLLIEPEAGALAGMPRARALREYWRLLFHARLHAALAERIERGELTPDTVRERVEALGAVQFDEIRTVLRGEDLQLPPAADLDVYEEFVAFYCELEHFAPALVASCFPSLDDRDAVQRLIAADVDAQAIYRQTTLAGAVENPDDESGEEPALVAERVEPTVAVSPRRSEQTYCRVMERADRARARGNLVRSAILRWQATRVVGPKLARAARHEARHDLERLLRRLRAAIELDETTCDTWTDALAALLPPAARGFWTAEARLLYDLQKVCVDHERGVFRLDLWGWLRWRGRSPLRRPLPAQRRVLMIKHLHGAQARLHAVRIAPHHRQALAALVENAVTVTERTLAANLRPPIAQAFDEVGLVPCNLPERIARDKLVEELIDQIVDRGYLAMGDLRDAISRNNLKLRDMGFPHEFLNGDQLLEVDRRLGQSLDGVYRRGEIYLRVPQFLSSLAFGTPNGRLTTLNVLLPFGSAFTLVEALHHVAQKIGGLEESDWRHYFAPEFVCAVLTLGLILFGLINHERFRQGCQAAALGIYRCARLLTVDLPIYLLNLPLVRTLLDSHWVKIVRRYALKPAAFSVAIVLTTTMLGRHGLSWKTDLAIFLATNLLVNSRLGRMIDELFTDWLVRAWHHVRIHIVANVFRFITDTFERVLQAVERFIYTVDEWLRFRSGENRATIAVKAVAGVVWAFVSYLMRIFVNVLIEPQFNPIKHFPVVTVSHKILLPLTGLIASQLEPLGKWEANTIAGTTVLLLPGVFGFLVWELKENWRLYAANRRPNLHPVPVGRRGETIDHLLRPGFHSGTLPKTFARLRRATRKGLAGGSWTAARKCRSQLDRVALDVRRFVERELVALLERSGSWREGELHVGRVHVGVNNIRLELCHDDGNAEPLEVAFEEHGGWLVVESRRPAWIEELAEAQCEALDAALAGLYKVSGVDIVREQVESSLPANTTYALIDDGLVVRWPAGQSGAGATGAVFYDLEQDPRMTPVPMGPHPAGFDAPTLERRRVLFGAVEMPWNAWVRRWTTSDSPAASPQPASS